MVWYKLAIQDYGLDYGFTSEQTRFDFAILRKIAKPILTVLAILWWQFQRNGVERIGRTPVFVDAHTVEVKLEKPLRPSIIVRPVPILYSFCSWS